MSPRCSSCSLIIALGVAPDLIFEMITDAVDPLLESATGGEL